MSHNIILMYHGIISRPDQIPPNREEGAELYDVSFENFKAHMGFLHFNKFPVGIMDNASAGGKIIITFDDGEKNNFEAAFPVLKVNHFQAYFFVTVNRIGQAGYMNWDELRELKNQGMIIGSHSLNHVVLTELNDENLKREMTESKKILESQLSQQIGSLSIPRGFYDERVLNAARQAGFKQIFVSENKDAEVAGVIARVAVKGDWPLKRFENAVLGKTPLHEEVFNFIKNNVKEKLGTEQYNRFRKFLLDKGNKK